jgi:beta-1,4-mannosyltransferase
MPSSHMTVYFAPLNSGSNPYLGCLKESLSVLGILCEKARYDSGWVRTLPRNSIIHMHWPSVFYHSSVSDSWEERLLRWDAYLRDVERCGIRIVWTVHNLYPHESGPVAFEREARLLLIQHSSHLLVHCSEALRMLGKEFGPLPPTTVIPHPDFVDAYPPVQEQRGARKALGLRQDVFTVLFFGKLRAYKGINRLVAALHLANIAEWQLLIAGAPSEGVDPASLRGVADGDPRIHLVDQHIESEEVPIYFGAADVVALPYDSVLSSGTTALAHSMARPVVAPKCGCIGEMIPPHAGMTYEVKQEASLQTALEHMATQDCLLMGRLAHDRICSCSWRDYAARLKTIYDKS